MPLLPWQRHPWQRKTSAPASPIGLSSLTTPASPSSEPRARAPLRRISGEISRWLTGLCRPAPAYCPDDTLLSRFAAPLNMRDEGQRYGLSVDLPSQETQQVSVFARGQRLLVCAGDQARTQVACTQHARPQHARPQHARSARRAFARTTKADDPLAPKGTAASACDGCEAGVLLSSFTLPADADLPRMSAAFRKGALAVRVPKHSSDSDALDLGGPMDFDDPADLNALGHEPRRQSANSRKA